MSEPIKALIFDAEGVIIDTMQSVWMPADLTFCRRHNLIAPEGSFPDDLKVQLVGTKLSDGVEIIKKYFGIEGDSAAMLQERIDLADEYFKKQVDFIPGFVDFFTKHRQLPAAVGTSLKSQYLDIVENRLALSQYFGEHIYSIYAVGARSKPAPDVFLYAAKQLGVDPKYCVVFEDAPNGLAAAKSAGMRSIGITTTFPRDFLTAATQIVDTYNQVDLSRL